MKVQIIIAQFIGFVGMAVNFFVYQQNDKKKLLNRKMTVDALWAAHYVFLFAWTAAATIGISVVRDFIFSKRNKKCFDSIWIPVAFIILNLFCGVAFSNNLISFLPSIATSVAVVALWVKNTNITRGLSLPISLCLLIYNIYVKSWIGIVNEVIAISSIIIGFAKNFIIKGEKNGCK